MRETRNGTGSGPGMIFLAACGNKLDSFMLAST